MIKVRDKQDRVTIEMHPIDARTVIAAQPDRYEIIPDKVVLALEEEAKLKEIKKENFAKAASERAKEQIKRANEEPEITEKDDEE